MNYFRGITKMTMGEIQMAIYDGVNEIFVLVEEFDDGWRELITSYRKLEDATQTAKNMRKEGRKISVECILLHEPLK